MAASGVHAVYSGDADNDGDKGDAHEPELIIRELDMDRIKEVRDGWAFYRGRRPDAYDEIVES